MFHSVTSTAFVVQVSDISVIKYSFIQISFVYGYVPFYYRIKINKIIMLTTKQYNLDITNDDVLPIVAFERLMDRYDLS